MQSVYQKINDIVCQIPRGRVSTYGRIAKMVPGCTARMVGYAMAALDENSDVPWQRVINAKGKISPRSAGEHDLLQEQLLLAEGILFNNKGQIDLSKYTWPKF